MYVAWHAVHDPLEVDERFRARFDDTIDDADRRTLAGMVAQLDEGVGNITAALRRKGDAFWANTLMIVTTDNGGPVCLNMSTKSQRVERTTRDCGTNNAPLRGSKMTLWQAHAVCRIDAYQ
jgi:arylsulfatase A-like enzyme